MQGCGNVAPQSRDVPVKLNNMIINKIKVKCLKYPSSDRIGKGLNFVFSRGDRKLLV